MPPGSLAIVFLIGCRLADKKTQFNSIPAIIPDDITFGLHPRREPKTWEAPKHSSCPGY